MKYTYTGGNVKRKKEVTHLVVDPSVKVIKDYAFSDSEKLTSIEISEGVEVIGYCTFARCQTLVEVNLPSTVREIHRNAFKGCKKLRSIQIPGGVETIGGEAFASCENLESLVFLSTSPVEIDGNAFTNCRSFNVSFPEDDSLKIERLEGNTLLHSFIRTKCPITFIISILEQYPNAIYRKNILGQTPLHLCIINNVKSKITEIIYNAWPEAVSAKNELSKTPVDYWRENGSDQKIGRIIQADNISETVTITAFVLKDNMPIMSYKDPAILQGHHLLLEIPKSLAQNKICISNKKQVSYGKLFLDQLQARNMLFGMLLTEFSKLIGFEDNTVIQRAAAIQALCSNHLTTADPKLIDFKAFSSTALWYQQEILSLVLRVYCEDQLMDNLDDNTGNVYIPSALKDAERGKQDLSKGNTPVPSKHRSLCFMALKDFLVKDLRKDDYNFQGPVLKSLQSLFNKTFIRRGQTQVKIIGDMTRATLCIKKKRDLKIIIARLKNNISRGVKPDSIGIESFFEEVSTMKRIPGTEIIPYRLKANSSQRETTDPLLFNLNFFDEVPEYHRVGNTDMIVAFELQIGLEAEINRLRTDHVAYERDRILKSQSLLKFYLEANTDIIEKTASTHFNHISEADKDFKLISAVLEGNFYQSELRRMKKEVISGNDKTQQDCFCGGGETLRPLDQLGRLLRAELLPFNQFGKLFGKAEDQLERLVGGSETLRPLDQLCLNNKRLNIWAKQGKAVILDGPFAIDPSLQYSVKSLVIKLGVRIKQLSVGLFAAFGPYIVQISATFVGKCNWIGKDLLYDDKYDNISIIQPKVNYLTMERISMLPSGCDKIFLVAWGEPHLYSFNKGSNSDDSDEENESDATWVDVNRNYSGMELVLNRYKKFDG